MLEKSEAITVVTDCATDQSIAPSHPLCSQLENDGCYTYGDCELLCETAAFRAEDGRDLDSVFQGVLAGSGGRDMFGSVVLCYDDEWCPDVIGAPTTSGTVSIKRYGTCEWYGCLYDQTTLCAPGYYATDWDSYGGAFLCSKCPIGKYNPTTTTNGISACKSCATETGNSAATTTTTGTTSINGCILPANTSQNNVRGTYIFLSDCNYSE